MAEQKTNLKVHITGTVEGHEEVDVTHEGEAVLAFVGNGVQFAGSAFGEMGEIELVTVISALKNMVGYKMFYKAMSLFLALSMARTPLGGAEEEEENERKAAEAAGEVHDGEEA